MINKGHTGKELKVDEDTRKVDEKREKEEEENK